MFPFHPHGYGESPYTPYAQPIASGGAGFDVPPGVAPRLTRVQFCQDMAGLGSHNFQQTNCGIAVNISGSPSVSVATYYSYIANFERIIS